MIRLVNILVLLVLVSCKTDKPKNLTKSSFDLKKDFSKITESITDQDTIDVFVNLNLYYHDFRNERLKISSFGDSLKISISGRVGFEIRDEKGDLIESIHAKVSKEVQGLRKPETIKIHKNDTLWKLDSLIRKNLDSMIIPDKMIGIPKLIFRNNTDTLYFDFSSKRSWKTFKKEYCEMMYKITPQNEFYNTFAKDYYSK